MNPRSSRSTGWRHVLLAVVVGALVIAGCGGDDETTTTDAADSGESTSLEGTTIHYLGFGGTTDEAMQKVWFKPFEKETGAKVVLDSPTDYNKLKVQQQSDNVTYDLVDGDAFVMDPGCGKEWQPLNVDTSAVLDRYKPKSECTVPDYVYTYVISYTPDLADDPPSTCEDFFDTSKYPGKRQVWSYYYGSAPECAAVAAGADVKNPYPLDMEAVGDKLSSIKDDLRIFDTSQQAADAMANNDVEMSITTTRMVLAANDEANAGWQIADGWSSTGSGTFGIPTGAPNPDGARALLEYIMKPENNPKFAEELPAYGSVTQEEPPESAKSLETPLLASGSKELLDAGSLIDWNWWAENDKAFAPIWASSTTG